ncbi:MAG: BRCT domain-containing protein [Acidobacteriota bacterium]
MGDSKVVQKPELDVAAVDSKSSAREAIEFENPLFGEGKGGPLEGLIFVFTGQFQRWTREEAKRFVEARGGQAASGVSGRTDFVVAGPGAGSKREEAQQRDIPILSEDEFLDFVEQRS